MSASGRCRETGAPIFIFYFGRNIDYPVLSLLLAVRTVWLNIFVYMFHVGIFLREKYVWQLSSEKKKFCELWSYVWWTCRWIPEWRAGQLEYLPLIMRGFDKPSGLGFLYPHWEIIAHPEAQRNCPFFFSEKIYYFSYMFKPFSHPELVFE